MALDFNFNGEPSPVSKDSLAIRRKLAATLLQQGTDTSPVRAWSQGAARLAQSLMGGLDLGMSDVQEARAQKQAVEDAISGIGSGGQPPMAPPGAPPVAAGMPSGATPAGPPMATVGAPPPPSPTAPADFADRFGNWQTSGKDVATVLGRAANGDVRPPGGMQGWMPDTSGGNNPAAAMASVGQGMPPQSPPPSPVASALMGPQPPQGAPATPPGGIAPAASALAGPPQSPLPSGVTPGMIRAMSNEFLPPAVANVLANRINQTLAPPQLKLIKNALSEEIPYLWSPQSSSLKPLNASDSGTAIPGGQPQSPLGGTNLITASNDPRTAFASDPNDAVMDKLVAPFGKDAPAVKAAAKSYINGDVMPTGNPRQQAIAQHAKSIAQQWGQATGEDVSDARFNAMRKMQTEYSSGAPTSLGGQRNAGNTAIRHLGELSKAAADLENWSLPGGVLPSIAHFINYARQEGTDDQKAKANGLADVLDRYVAEVGRFYAGSSSGGVGEREAARQRFSSAKTPKELAAAIQYERDLMHGKLQQLEDQRDQTFEGRTVPRIIGDIVQPRAKTALDDIETNLGRLKGTAPKQSASGNTELPRPATPEDARKLKAGTRFIDPNGVERVR